MNRIFVTNTKSYVADLVSYLINMRITVFAGFFTVSRIISVAILLGILFYNIY